MRISQLTVAGFRGFNEERTIYFDRRLTLIAAPNSHGKTSITEALEFLLFGHTSKVAHAMSKEAFRDSYRNKHWPSDQPAYIDAIVVGADDASVTLRVELDASGTIRRFVDGAVVSAWSFDDKQSAAASPFILQHALKYLLLVPPNDRFQGFARLLGLDDVDSLQREIVSLCTKPEATIPLEGRALLNELQTLRSRFLGLPFLEQAKSELGKGPEGIKAAYLAIAARAEKLLKTKVPETERVARLIRLRDDHAAKVFSGTVGIQHLDDHVRQQLNADTAALASAVATSFVDDYAKLAARGVTERLAKEARLLALGSELIDDSTDTCPLCSQHIDDSAKSHIRQRHQEMEQSHGAHTSVLAIRTRIQQIVADMKTRVTRSHSTVNARYNQLFSAMGDHQQKIADLFGVDNQASWEIVRSAALDLTPLRAEHEAAHEVLVKAVQVCQEAADAGTENTAQAETLGNAVSRYLEASHTMTTKLDALEPSLVGPARILRQAIDAIAGTTEVSLLIDLEERRPTIERALRLEEALASLKELKRAVEQTVGEIMEAAINADLSGSVMDWYGKLRTKGDPDVHFSGFAMQKTKDGDFKKGKVGIGAKSYGVDLASAVSSLSESKLNALGLCVSIASALRSSGPWEFLVLDDPIQSWDAEHEAQFVEVVRILADKEGKQIILLTHKSDWAQQVSMGCRALNGLRLEVTSYSKEGPHLREVAWASVDQRIAEADALANSHHATGVQLQQAEAEIRLAVCQLAADVAQVKLARITSPHNLNKNSVRNILNEAACPSELVDKVYATFGTADDAHHAPKTYSANAQRVRKYVAILRELQAFNKAGNAKGKPRT